MIIDMHTHTFPTKIAQNAVHDLEQRSKTQAVANGTQDELLEQMNEAGVDISVIAPVATSPKQVESINRHAEDTCRLVNLGRCV